MKCGIDLSIIRNKIAVKKQTYFQIIKAKKIKESLCIYNIFLSLHHQKRNINYQQ